MPAAVDQFALHTDAGETVEQRDLLLRRLIVIFIFAAVATFWTAVGMAAWNEASHRVELAQQKASVLPRQP